MSDDIQFTPTDMPNLENVRNADDVAQAGRDELARQRVFWQDSGHAYFNSGHPEHQNYCRNLTELHHLISEAEGADDLTPLERKMSDALQQQERAQAERQAERDGIFDELGEHGFNIPDGLADDWTADELELLRLFRDCATNGVDGPMMDRLKATVYNAGAAQHWPEIQQYINEATTDEERLAIIADALQGVNNSRRKRYGQPLR